MQPYRRLPHWLPENAAIFVTWRLAGTMPVQPPEVLTAKFESYDEYLDRLASGPVWLQDTRIATLVANALEYGAGQQIYELYAWVIMPNHVHAVLAPKRPLPRIMQWLKGRTARLANRILNRTGEPFWQDESYDHWIRSSEELQDVIRYVENNPVKAGLVKTIEQWRWSSAYRK